MPVEKEYTFDRRSQLLAYNIMFGPDYAVGACPGARTWPITSTRPSCTSSIVT